MDTNVEQWKNFWSNATLLAKIKEDYVLFPENRLLPETRMEEMPETLEDCWALDAKALEKKARCADETREELTNRDTSNRSRTNRNKPCPRTVKKWGEFWNAAAAMSKEKQAKLKPLKEAEARKAIVHWMQLYYKRWDSILDHEDFKSTPIPEGALDRVGEWGVSDDGDCWYEATWYPGRHGNPLDDGWVLEHSIPLAQRDEPLKRDENPRYEAPVLQILSFVRIKGRSKWAGLALSDGDHIVLGVLRLNPPLKNMFRKLRKYTIVKLHEYHMEYDPAPIVYVKSFEIWNEVINTKVRSPKDIAVYTQNDIRQIMK